LAHHIGGAYYRWQLPDHASTEVEALGAYGQMQREEKAKTPPHKQI